MPKGKGILVQHPQCLNLEEEEVGRLAKKPLLRDPIISENSEKLVKVLIISCVQFIPLLNSKRYEIIKCIIKNVIKL